MTISNIALMYFSPTGTTKRVSTFFAETLTKHLTFEKNIECGITELDLTDSDSFAPSFSLGEDTLLIISTPVYSGRVPPTMLERIKNLKGSNTPAVLLVTYGHRHYDDSLLELKTILEEKEITAIAAAAVVSKHNMVNNIAVSHPNEADHAMLTELTKAVIGKLDAAKEISSISPINVGGSTPFREYSPASIKPFTASSCSSCGLCAEKCPVKAISFDNPKIVDNEKCITCMRCTDICPNGSRKFHLFQRIMLEALLKKKCAGVRATEIFI